MNARKSVLLAHQGRLSPLLPEEVSGVTGRYEYPDRSDFPEGSARQKILV